MSKPRATLRTIRVSVYLYPETAALLSLACADTAFGGIKYGEQTRIVNLALDRYLKGAQPCTTPPQSPGLMNSEQLALPDD